MDAVGYVCTDALGDKSTLSPVGTINQDHIFTLDILLFLHKLWPEVSHIQILYFII